MEEGEIRDFPEEFTDKPEEPETSLDALGQYGVQEYLKVGTFCGWSWNDYLDTPRDVIDLISLEIDKRLQPYCKSTGSDSESVTPVNYFHLALLLALSSLFGSSDKD